MTDDSIDPPESIDSQADLIEYLDRVAAAYDDLRADVNRLDNLVVRSLENSNDTDDDLKALAQEVDRLRDELDLVNSTMPEQQKGKLDKVRAIIEFGMTDATGGRSGVKVDTGEAAAASGGSRDTARRLMDEIGANFSWAKTETPGGPNPKVLKLNLQGRTADDLMSDVRQHYTGDASA